MSVSVGTSGTSPTGGAPTVYHNSGSDSSVTHSAVENGLIIVRDKDKQQQDINTLSRDTENANNSLGQIFDKQKELDKIESVELVKDIAAQAKDILKKYDRIQAQNEVNENREELAKREAQKVYDKLSDEEKAAYTLEQFYEANKDGWYYAAVDEQVKVNLKKDKNLGTMGGNVSKGIDAATSIVTGFITGDITGGLAGASAPYLATLIKENTYAKDENGHYIYENGEKKVDTAANLIAHAILGAVVAELQGNSGLAGGMGAVTGEVAAQFIAKNLYGKELKDLTEAEKENISALSQLASGLAVASVGGSTSDVGAAIASSKNAVENNSLVAPIIHGVKYITKEGTKTCLRNSICRNEAIGTIVNVLNYFNIPVSLESLTDEKIEELVDYLDMLDLFSLEKVSSSKSIQVSKYKIEQILSNDTTTDNSDSQASAGTQTGSVAAGGGASLPPDDDKDKNDSSNKIKEEKLNDLPDNVQDTYSKYEKNGWNGNFNGQTPGTNAGRTYKNSDNKLPTIDSKGNPINYREFDVNNKIPGQFRDAERFLKGSDGSVYYTNNHYQTFIKLIK